ncbi:hypothetical protein [Devosia naphthalenivorans]|uniref:hypothetical protein n=1 Tax=Devosia naphthalenivorans TaxID=2082392 RepID=UPI0013B061F5|nr:hypothetical protein [Devosia naphthalenivorans]
MSLRLRNADDQRITGAFEVHTSQTAAMMIPNSELVPGTYNAEARIGQGEAVEWEFTVSDNQIPEPGLGGPILVIGSDSVVFDDFYAEILRAEGLTSFTTTEAANLTRDILFSHQVAILAEPVLDNALMPIIEDWLERGGNLIAVRPSGELAALSGLMPASSTLDDAYLRIDTSAPPGQGLVGETIQFHGTADIVSTTPDIRTIATLFSDATSSAIAPALTIRPIGTAGGEIAAFTFDLARSVVLLGQGNLEWAGQERDGLDPIRPNDLFFGGTGDNAEPDFVDLNKVAIPQADEQMRMLSNLITHMMRDTAPLPRFWYFPKGAKALLVMAADDHGTRDRTNQSFDRMLVLGPENCDVANWECARATSWMERSSGMSDRQAAGYVDQGFDIGGHASTHCHDWSGYTLTRAFFEDLLDFRLVFPSVPPQQGSRFHCIVWSDYASQPHIERGWGIRYDMNYYYWPKDWIDGRAGFMTGSGLPMRFSDEQGRLIDVYQQETHLVDEVFSSSFEAVEALIDRALGPEAYCGAFGTHYDFHNPFDVQLMDLATDRGVPLVSAQQMLDWTDGRNGSNFGDVRWEESTLSFAVRTDPRTGRMLEGMLPLQFSGETLQEIRREGEAIAFRSETIKGIGYGFFDAVTGAYTATYLQR